MVVLFNAGDQAPIIPLLDVVGKGGIVAPKQTGVIAVKVGFTFGVIVITDVVEAAHCPAVGVKV